MPFPFPGPRARFLRRLACGCALPFLLLLSCRPLPAQTPKTNVLTNGGFEQAAPAEDNLWDGVDSEGYLSVPRYGAWVLTDRGNFGPVAMPPSVAFLDLNGDGKPDLLVADPTGYFHFYPNHGTAAAPKFTHAELLPLYLSTTFRPRNRTWDWNNNMDDWRFCPRFALADWRGHGLLDLVVGNYFGELFFVPNAGKPGQPIFRQPLPIDSARVVTSEKNRSWANLLSPVAYNPNAAGRPDLVTGEGTYSANAVHLLENVGNGDAVRFTDARHSRIAYGDGREQLIPAVVDFDGDGRPDLLVADRNGEVSVYLNPGPSKPGTEFKRVSTLTFGGNARLPGLVAPYAADFNGDGLFDLIFGLPDGRIAVSLNTGTKTEPVFGPLQNIRGQDVLGRNVRLPQNVQTTTFPMYGNALAYFTVVNAQEDPASAPTEGSNCLKAGFWPQPAAKTFGLPPDGIPGTLKHFNVTFPDVTLDINKPYNVSFRVKASGMEKLHYDFQHYFNDTAPSARIERGERGEVKNRGDRVVERVVLGADFTASEGWHEVTGTILPRYQNAKLASLKTMRGGFEIEFWATGLSSVLYLDDVQLLKVGK